MARHSIRTVAGPPRSASSSPPDGSPLRRWPTPPSISNARRRCLGRSRGVAVHLGARSVGPPQLPRPGRRPRTTPSCGAMFSARPDLPSRAELVPSVGPRLPVAGVGVLGRQDLLRRRRVLTGCGGCRAPWPPRHPTRPSTFGTVTADAQRLGRTARLRTSERVVVVTSAAAGRGRSSRAANSRAASIPAPPTVPRSPTGRPGVPSGRHSEPAGEVQPLGSSERPQCAAVQYVSLTARSAPTNST